jgi:hypothetical protein
MFCRDSKARTLSGSLCSSKLKKIGIYLEFNIEIGFQPTVGKTEEEAFDSIFKTVG